MPDTIGLDYGTNSARALVVDCSDGREIGTAVVDYPSGNQGILLKSSDHHLARQSPNISQRSGVSVRLSVSNQESLVANAARHASSSVHVGVHEHDGAVVVTDANTGETVKVVEFGQGGFLRATMRRMANRAGSCQRSMRRCVSRRMAASFSAGG